MKPTIPNLRRTVVAAGGTLEEDESGRDTRTLQAVAPDGHRWAGPKLQCVPIIWACRDHLASARRFNAASYQDALAQLKGGLEPIPADQAEYYATD